MGDETGIAFDGLEADTEVDALNDALPEGARGYFARHMNGDVMWHEAPDRERCGGHGWITCHCGGDLCVCGNGGEIDCYGCEDCEPSDDVDSWGDEEDDDGR